MEKSRPEWRRWWGAALLVAAAAILGHQLLFRPIVGLADNGDYARVTDHLGLALEAASPPEDQYFRFVVRRYRTRVRANERRLSKSKRPRKTKR